MTDFETQLVGYVQAISTFRAEHGLPAGWFTQPDHVAIKCADKTDYEATVAAWLPRAAQATVRGAEWTVSG